MFIFAPIILKAMISDAISSELIFAFRSAIIIYALYSLNAVGFFTLLGVNLVGKCMSIRFGSAALSLLLIYWGASQWGLVGACLGNGGYLLTLLMNYMAIKHLFILSTNARFLLSCGCFFPYMVYLYCSYDISYNIVN